MPLTRPLHLAGVVALVLALVAALGAHLGTARDALEDALQARNRAAAQSLAVVLSQPADDALRPEALLAAQAASFDRLRLMRDDGQAGFDHVAPQGRREAPAWFSRWWPVEAAPGVAAVVQGGRPLGTLEVAVPVAEAQDALWRGAVTMAAWLAAIGLVAIVVAVIATRRARQPLVRLAAQARAVLDGGPGPVDVPAVAELRPLAQALNASTQRARGLFEAQAAQFEALRRQSLCDPLTGLPHRAAFVEQVGGLLTREDGLDGGSLVLVRLADLAGLNRTLGRASADQAVRVVAELLQAYPARVADSLCARLNGADFALLLPAPGIAAETTDSVAAALASALAAIGRQVHVHVGAVEFQRGHTVGELLAAADLALARAETRGAFAIEVVVADGERVGGEHAWREQVSSALAQRRVELGQYPLVDARRRVLHLECPLRLQLVADGPHVIAARWLPLAQRSGLVPEADLCALSLALEAIGRDGQARAVHVAPASLADGDFATRVQQRLRDRPPPPGRLWLDVPERAGLEQFERLQRSAQLLRPLGVRLGLEHAGLHLARIERLYELGLDFVKLDASLCVGAATSEAARQVLRATVAMLRPLSIQVFAEGVADERDAQVLFALGVDGVGGPWARAPG